MGYCWERPLDFASTKSLAPGDISFPCKADLSDAQMPQILTEATARQSTSTLYFLRVY